VFGPEAADVAVLDATAAGIAPFASVVIEAATKVSQLVGTPAEPVIDSLVEGAKPDAETQMAAVVLVGAIGATDAPAVPRVTTAEGVIVKENCAELP